MSISLTNVQITAYDAMVKAAYQSAGHNLPSTTRMRTGFEGKFIQFPKTGYLTSVEQAYQDTVTLQDPGHTKVTLEVKKYVTPAGTDELQGYTVNFDDRAENVKLAVMAVKRRQDQIVMNGLLNSGTTNTIADGGTNMTYLKFLQIAEYFEENNVPDTDRHILIPAAAARAMLKLPEVINNDYMKQNHVATGSLNGSTFLGIKIHVIGTMVEGGLNKVGNIVKCYAYHSAAMGFGMNRDFQTRIDYLPRETTWQVNSIHQSGAIAIDVDGIYEVSVDVTA